jgi:hypothetical protein
MSPVRPCTSTAAWPWYKSPDLAELARPTKSCYVIRAFYAAPGGDTNDGGWRRNPSAEATFKQASEEKNG